MPVVSSITREQVLQYLDEKGDDNAQQHADAIRKYREQYGI